MDHILRRELKYPLLVSTIVVAATTFGAPRLAGPGDPLDIGALTQRAERLLVLRDSEREPRSESPEPRRDASRPNNRPGSAGEPAPGIELADGDRTLVARVLAPVARPGTPAEARDPGARRVSAGLGPRRRRSPRITPPGVGIPDVPAAPPRALAARRHVNLQVASVESARDESGAQLLVLTVNVTDDTGAPSTVAPGALTLTLRADELADAAGDPISPEALASGRVAVYALVDMVDRFPESEQPLVAEDLHVRLRLKLTETDETATVVADAGAGDSASNLIALTVPLEADTGDDSEPLPPEQAPAPTPAAEVLLPLAPPPVDAPSAEQTVTLAPEATTGDPSSPDGSGASVNVQVEVTTDPKPKSRPEPKPEPEPEPQPEPEPAPEEPELEPPATDAGGPDEPAPHAEPAPAPEVPETEPAGDDVASAPEPSPAPAPQSPDPAEAEAAAASEPEEPVQVAPEDGAAAQSSGAAVEPAPDPAPEPPAGPAPEPPAEPAALAAGNASQHAPQA